MKLNCEQWVIDAFVELATTPTFMDWDIFFQKYPQLKQYDIPRRTRASEAHKRE